MNILATRGWEEYSLLDSGNGKRLEQFGPYTLVKPDPQCLWQPHLDASAWEKADATFVESEKKGHWVKRGQMPDSWTMHYKQLQFTAKLSPFKHTGVFPEQHENWDWLEQKIHNAKNEGQETLKVLNLFGYTGIASLACAAAGAEVTHIDASFPTVGWARENQALSKLNDKKIRWILDDCLKFVEREVRRGNKYDGIIMDPPVFGHGPKGERWEFSESFPQLIAACQKILSDHPLFLLINAYAVSASAIMLENVLQDVTKGLGGTIESGELALQEKESNRLLSTGIFGRWSQ